MNLSFQKIEVAGQGRHEMSEKPLMSSAKDFSVIFAAGTLELRLGQPLVEVLELLAKWNIRRIDDEGMRRVYIGLVGHGVEIMFEDGLLVTVFHYLSGGPAELGVFDGWIDILDRETLLNMDEGRFVNTLLSKGFVLSEKRHPSAIDLLSDSMRVRLSKRNGQVRILIDDGAMIRK